MPQTTNAITGMHVKEKWWGKQMISIQSTHLVSTPSRVITELSQEMNFLSLQRLCYVKCKNINKTLPGLILCLWGCTFAFVRGFWLNPAKWSTEILKRLVLRFVCIFLHLKTSTWFGRMNSGESATQRWNHLIFISIMINATPQLLLKPQRLPKPALFQNTE